MTTAKQALIADSRNELVKDLASAIEERSGFFDRDVVTLKQIELELDTSMRGKSKTQLQKALLALRAIAFGQQRVPGINAGGLDRASLWAIRNARFWVAAGPQARGEEYRRSEGLLSQLDGLPFEILHESDWPG